MCGFAGVIDLRATLGRDALTAILASMTDAIAHRGPDDSGFWAEPETGVGLGFRRLAILDLTPEGHQPMTSACGRYVMVFNGEVYNHGNLRTELGGGDRDWRGRSDQTVNRYYHHLQSHQRPAASHGEFHLRRR